MTETINLALRITADPETFRGGDGHPSTPLERRVRDEVTAALAEIGATVEPPPRSAGDLLDAVDAELQKPGYSIIRGWLAIHGGASTRIVLEELTQLVRTLGPLNNVFEKDGAD